jgi:hypothetical protein
LTDPLRQEEERLRAAIRQDTEGLREAVDTLQSAAARRFSARHSIEQRPLAWLGGALILGWVIGSRLR